MAIESDSDFSRRAGKWSAALRQAGFTGAMIRATDSGYDDARAVWNGMIQRRPALILRPTDTDSVGAAVRLAADRDLDLAVRGGGHNVAGTAVCDAGVVLDMAAFDAVEVDSEARTVRVGGGASWAQVDRATQQHGLATPGGVVSDTGVAGLTLGGGFGHLRRKLGLSCDNLRAVEIVTADGHLITASASSRPELFWALQGGGGNFGVVTTFEFELHPLGPEIATLFVWYRGEQAAAALRALRGYSESAPDEASVLAFHAFVPRLAAFPREHWGEPALAFLGTYAGDPEAGERELRTLREIAQPIADFSARGTYVELQQTLDEDYPRGLRYYWKSAYLNGLSDELIELLCALASQSPSPLSTIDIWQLGGAVGRVPEAESAFGNRAAPYMIGLEANWENPWDDAANLTWARDVYARLKPYTRAGLYVNFAGFGEEGEQLTRDTYGPSFDRLVAVKNRYDPNNVFHINQNIAPHRSDRPGA